MTIASKLLDNAMRMTWFMIIVSSIVMLSGVYFCYLGVTGNNTTLEFLGLKIETSTVGLVVIAFGVLIFYSQRKFFSHLVDPDNMVKLFSNMSRAIDTIHPDKGSQELVLPQASAKTTDKSTKASSPIATTTISDGKDIFIMPEGKWRECGAKAIPKSEPNLTGVIVQIALSLIGLIISLSYLLWGEGTDVKKYAIGLFALIVGYWLK